MKRKEQKTQRGITLIALVITIIVLLILAGVAINMAINSDGLFGKANEAAEKWNTAVENESTSITNLLEIANNVGGSDNGGDDDDDDDDTPTLPAGWDATKVATTVTETSLITGTNKERIVPIPKGFVASQIGGATPENTVSGGLVIYQTGDADTTAEGFWTNTDTDGNLVCQTTYNQYVWIPVDDINQMVMCKSNASGSICDLNLVNGILQCTNTAHSATATDLCGRLYGTTSTTTDTSKPKTYTTTMNFSNKEQTWSDTGYREPAILSYDSEERTGGLTAFTAQMINDFKDMATSVTKYGGFYVSRYEAEENVESKKNKVVITAETNDSTVYKGVNMWYGLYSAVHSKITVGTSTIQSHMIYGSQYDQIINFIGSEAQIGHYGNVVTSQSCTGSMETDRLKNIYDLEGNNYEWTAQALDAQRILRGGYCVYAGNRVLYPASYRTNSMPNGQNQYYATRISFYL